MQCKVCFKYRHAINEHGECIKCSSATDKRKDVMLHVRKRGRDEMTPFLSNRKILSKEEWLTLKRLIDRFYNNISMEEIQAYNENIEISRRKTKRSAKTDEGVIYLLESDNGFYKIGKSKDLDRRVGQHLRDYPVSLDVIHVIQVYRMTKCEVYLLSLFGDKKKQGEWFDLSPDDVEWLCSLDTTSLESLANDDE